MGEMGKISFGFTLVELTIVILILGIVAATAIPSIHNTLNGIKLEAAAREVVSAIQYSQSLAIKTGSLHKVNFNVSQDKLKCSNSLTGLTPLHPINKKPFEIDFQLEGYLQGVDILSASFGPGSKSDIQFDRLGEFYDTGAVILGYAGLQIKINVAAPLGKVTVN